MDTDKFKNDLMIGETSSIEFKRCGNEVEHDHTSAGVVGIPTDQDLKNDIAEFRKLNEEVKVAQKPLR